MITLVCGKKNNTGYTDEEIQFIKIYSCEECGSTDLEDVGSSLTSAFKCNGCGNIRNVWGDEGYIGDKSKADKYTYGNKPKRWD